MTWLVCSYRLPREPSRLRLAVWRRARRLGAVLLHDAIWVLPADAKTREDFDWLAEEIEERGGTALLFEATSIPGAQDRAVVARFREDADARYQELATLGKRLLAKAGRKGLTTPRREALREEARELGRTLALERRRDFFRATGVTVVEGVLRQVERALGMGSGTNPGRADAVGD